MMRKLTLQLASAFMWCVIALGVAVIFLDAWRRIDLRYASEGFVTEALMAVIMGGIPSIAFAGVVHVGFRLLFGSPVVASPPKADISKKKTNTQSGQHDFID